MNVTLADGALVVGRILLGGVFLMGGIEHAFSWKPLVEVMANRGVPTPLVVLIVGSVFQGVLGVLSATTSTAAKATTRSATPMRRKGS